MKSELGGKYDENGNIAWSLDFPDFTKSFFKNIIRDHESEGVDFWWLDWQQHLTSPYTSGLGQTFWCNHVFYNDMVPTRPSALSSPISPPQHPMSAMPTGGMTWGDTPLPMKRRSTTLNLCCDGFNSAYSPPFSVPMPPKMTVLNAGYGNFLTSTIC